ncbi:MAG: aspartate--tRNA(Asn) ligase [Candidatus Obscuribacterales bacterium]|nr:aspartate--tRNA(Asn) ligase [Candidatus Obscuribacterales bacterium]
MKKVTTATASTYAGQRIKIHGHIHAVRSLGALAFIILRDRNGFLQVVVNSSAVVLRPELPVVVSGLLQAHKTKPGEWELHAEEITPLSQACAALPVEISKEKRMEGLGLPALLDYRPLTLRNRAVRAIFKIEAEICRAFREFLVQEEFTEIHTPKIVATGTEGGAQLFALDYFGRQAYLAQSPQFYKQMMVAVFERVYEIGPVYRAEEHNTPRHLNEYLSMDIEMGFIENEQTLINLQTKLLAHIFAQLQENCAFELALYGCKVPTLTQIPQIKLADAHLLLRNKLGWQPREAESEDLDPEAERLLCSYFAQEEGCDLVYVTDYPWAVRPFYAMPAKAGKASHSFDLLFRGLEITTGGQRIHEYDQLLWSLETRGMKAEHFADYLQCFRYGMPPHGGLAIGLERLTKQLLGLSNVRQASLFPRDGNRISP